MNDAMTYKGYTARISYDDTDGVFFGRLSGIRDGVSFHADTVADLRLAFQEAVDDYLETCARVGKAPQIPVSGQIMVPLDPDLHRRAAQAADREGKSLIQWAQEVLETATLQRSPES